MSIPAHAATTQIDYTGRRHARITRSMKALPRAVLQILTELRYSIRDSETQAISNAVLAQRTHLSEGFVSAAVRWLAGEAIPYVPQLARPPAHVFIERRLRQDGQPGYEITMLVPPELRPRSGGPFRGITPEIPLPTRQIPQQDALKPSNRGIMGEIPASLSCIQTKNQ